MKILIVDDELVSRMKMEKLVQSLGHQILVAQDGEEGFRLWQKEAPRMVITDWVMPGMDGLELCRSIRQAQSSDYTYLIMVTSKSETSDIVTGMKAGADDFIAKPFVKDEVAVRIRAGERILGRQPREMVIFAMAKLAESRDQETGFHLERIRYYSRLLAENLAGSINAPQEIDSRFIDNIFHTSPLHDIGKIGIPDYILLKPGQLDEQEFELMKNHSRIGFDTLNEALKRYPQADYLKMSAEIARSHHEKFNGKGYPDGLKGEEIPLSARIVALADVYDALISKRIYKNAYTHEIARSIIIQDTGTHFDPQVVAAFLASEKRFVEIAQEFKESGAVVN